MARSWTSSDPASVLAAVKSNSIWLLLQYAPESCRSNPEIVLAAVKSDWRALQLAAECCRSDPEIVLAAVRQNAEALTWASDELLKDESFAAEAKRGCFILRITLMSGRCALLPVWRRRSRPRDVICSCCERLNMEYTGRETLVHGLGVVRLDVDVRFWPGLQTGGSITDYQLVGAGP
mmetsp:Transcript_48950/g.90271  ORF Transcript_48950/g.90271 Transcript_48950/m.90271 type:complete len:178 (+) Transcript_48950:45-578(+)